MFSLMYLILFLDGFCSSAEGEPGWQWHNERMEVRLLVVSGAMSRFNTQDLAASCLEVSQLSSGSPYNTSVPPLFFVFGCIGFHYLSLDRQKTTSVG